MSRWQPIDTAPKDGTAFIALSVRVESYIPAQKVNNHEDLNRNHTAQ